MMHATSPEGSELLDRVAEDADLHRCTASRLQLIHRGDDHFGRMIDEIDRAAHEVCFEMYQLAPDRVGQRVVRALIDAAQRGVEVRVLLDTFGSFKARSLLHELRHGGVDARWFSPWSPLNDPNRRTHRKLVIVDGHTASIGGFNVSEQFSERCSGARSWRDLGLWIQGRAVRVFRAQFEQAWLDHGGSRLDTGGSASADDICCALSGGRSGHDGHASAYASLLDEARFEILIANPYFLPDSSFRARMGAAVERGVRVAVVVPRQNDLGGIKHLSRRQYRSLLCKGVEIWERHDRMVHAKAAVIDRRLAAIGSVNINPRSFQHNSETLLVTAERSTVLGVLQFILGEAWRASERLSHRSWGTHPDRQRLAETLSLPLALIF